MLNAISSGASWLCRTACAVVGSLVMLTAMGSSAFAITLPAPEIDPGSISSAMTLVVGTTLYIMGRRSKK